MTSSIVLDILGWVIILAVLVVGILASFKGKQLRAARQRKKAERIRKATERYYAATADQAADESEPEE